MENKKMKIITIPDLHGLDVWKNINPKNYDKIVFVGDFVDSFKISNIIMKQNLLDIIQFKNDNMDKVILLTGNHDIQYLTGKQEHRCSGFRPEMLWDFQQIFRENKDLFQIAYQIDNYLWTHAGVHKGWYKYSATPQIKECDLEYIPISDQLNGLFKYSKSCLHDVGYLRGGSKSVGGVFWADKRESSLKPLPGYHQIVGHHPVDEITTIKKDNDTSITYVDVFSGQYNFDINEDNFSEWFYELKINE